MVDVSKDGRLGADGLLTHQGAAPGRAESAVYDSRVWRVYCSGVL